MWKKKLNIDAISLLGCLEARRRRVGGCDLWPFVGWISLEIGGGRRRRRKGGERQSLPPRMCRPKKDAKPFTKLAIMEHSNSTHWSNQRWSVHSVGYCCCCSSVNDLIWARLEFLYMYYLGWDLIMAVVLLYSLASCKISEKNENNEFWKWRI